MINLALIGTGRLGALYLRLLTDSISGVFVQAIAGHRAASLARTLDTNCSSYPDYAQLLAHHPLNTLDGVIIAGSTDMHAACAMYFIALDIPIFCEKPLALTEEDAEEVCAKAESWGGIFQMGFMRRWDPATAQLARRVLDKTIGEPVLYRATSRDADAPPAGFSGGSGGIIFDMGVHDLDLARFLCGEVDEISARTARLVFPELDAYNDADNAVISLRFRSGALGVIDLSRNARYGSDNFCEVLGSQGALRVGTLQEVPLTMLNKDGVHQFPMPSYAERYRAAFIAQLQHFRDCIDYGRQPLVTAHDGLRATQLCLAAIHAAEYDHWQLI